MAEPARCRRAPSAKVRVALSGPVRAALAAGDPVVALESTIIAHGLPYPENVACALALEAAVRAGGAEPATVAVLGGVLHAGLSEAQVRLLALPAGARGGPGVHKLALRDIPRAVAYKLTGATTVSATSFVAASAGIPVFSTGGVGGVHRGPLDVSQDILSLASQPVLVVSAGVKSVLDVRATLEALEAAAVPILVWRSNRFPAFFTPDSGFPAPAVARRPADAAAVFCAARATGAAAGVLLAVPVPEEDAAAAESIERATQQALAECAQRRVAGSAVTPFLLRRIAEISAGESVRANLALAANNARIAAEVAVEIARMRRAPCPPRPAPDSAPAGPVSATGEIDAPGGAPLVVVAGVAAIDTICKPRQRLLRATSSPGHVVRALGGVACNVARAAAGARARVELLAAVGGDGDGRAVRDMLECAAVGTRSLVIVHGGRTPAYCALHDESGDLQAAVADMDSVGGEYQIARAAVALLASARGKGARVLAVDANLSPRTVHALCSTAKNHGLITWLEPTSVPKAARVAAAGVLVSVDIVSPNIAELQALAEGHSSGKPLEREEQNAHKLLHRGVKAVVVTRGEHGAALYMLGRSVFHVPAKHIVVRNTSGAGDALAGTMITHIAQHGISDSALRDALSIGVSAAAKVCSHDTSAMPATHARL